jgi:very-short-patch-repair endonuclease
MRRHPPDAERKLWSLLRSHRLAGWKFKRQQQIGDYIVDFACFDARLIVEADGSQHAGSAADVNRDAWLKAQGFRILRLWNNDILTNPNGVAAAIIAALETPLPDPLPQGERGSRQDTSRTPLPSRERKGPAAQRWDGEGASANGAHHG